MRQDWTIYVVCTDGSLFPHWTTDTRKSAREMLARLNAANPGRFTLPRDHH